MKRLCFVCASLWLCGVAMVVVRAQDARYLVRSSNAEPSVPVGLRCLQAAYPEHVCSVTSDALVLCDGQSIAYDDGRQKTHAQRLEDPDLEDMMSEPYPVALALPPGPDSEPGRVRYQPLFDRMYGSSAAAVRARFAKVAWLPAQSRRSVEVTTVNGVDARLRAVSAAIDRLSPELRASAAELAGTFNYRTVAGTERRSAHSYGIAIDVAPKLADYWRWREPGVVSPVRYRNRIPLEIVAAFEREGFIWGGRWNHYDTMHFEYRPELLVPECREPAADRGPNLQPTAASPAAPIAASIPAFAWPHAAAAQPLRERIAPPAGFQRVTLAAGSFGAWLRELPLQPGRGVVHLFDGRLKPAQSLHAAVIAIDAGNRDLQQCADAVMRLRAEYLFASRRADEICFRAVSGDAMPYAAYRRGLRPPRGRAAPWVAQVQPDASWSGFRAYLDRVFGIANTASLARELEPNADPRAITAGDVYIEGARGGRFGHAVLVLDVVENAAGERRFLIAQSYMPAQEMHVLVNPREPGSPWYRAPLDGSLSTPEWDFPRNSLRRFASSCAR